MSAHAERNRACVSRTDHGLLAQYGCDGAHEEAGLGRELIQPASLSPCHLVILLWIRRRVLLQLGQKGTLCAD